MGESRQIDVLMLAKNDWANTGYRFWRCVRSLGLNSIMFKGNAHPFAYPNQAPLHPSLTGLPVDLYPVTVMAPYLETLLAESKVVHFIGSTYVVVPNWDWARNGTKIVVQHGGSTYRLAPERCNQIFNPIASATIIQCPDLLGLGAKNETLIYYPVDTEKIQPDYTRPLAGKLVIGHFPSDPTVKGTATILKVIEKLFRKPAVSKRLAYQGVRNTQGTNHWVSWEENLARMKACDIIIETLNVDIAGRKYGEWGNTALEAAALGKIVITNSLATNEYRVQYGTPPALHIANTPEALEECLTALSDMSDSDIERRKHEARYWAQTYHSIPATAKRLWDKVYSHLGLELEQNDILADNLSRESVISRAGQG